MTRIGVTRLGLAQMGLGRLGLARLGLARSGLARLGLARLGLARLGIARLGLARLRFARFGVARFQVRQSGISSGGRPFVLVALGSVLLLSGTVLLGRRACLEIKGLVAGALVDRACAAYLRDGRAHPPWSWADTTPIGRLEVDRLGVSLPILSGASGTSMAFGIGHVDGTAPPNGRGNCALAGHRDRWMRFLADLSRGDRVRIRTSSGARDYVVDRLEVVPRTAVEVLDPDRDDRLTLITCYPLGGVRRSSERYVVSCRAAPATPARVSPAPSAARTSPSGARVRQGVGKERALEGS